jgi:hypothetical protein
VSEKKKRAILWWPTITDQASAIEASKAGFWAAVAVASFTAAFTTYVLVTQKEFTSLTAGAYANAVLFSIIAWRIRRYSKFFAIAGILLFIFEKIMQFFQGEGIKGLPLALLILLMFVSGVRGVFAYHRYSNNKLSTESV